MVDLILEDSREFIIPIFSVEVEGEGIKLETREFLGTAFLVTRQGDAITASHVLPLPENLPKNRRLIAIVQVGNQEEICWINQAAKFEKADLALIKVNLNATKYLEISEEKIFAGMDVQLIGIPSHEVSGFGKEMRLLKGHVTRVGEFLELNFPIPAGMSGSPIFYKNKVVAIANGVVRSEELEESTEEIETLSNEKEQIVLTKILRLTYYGLCLPLYSFRGKIFDVLDGMTLFSFIQARNK